MYWIHRPSDTNILTEGYVGITTNPLTRFESHRKAANRTKTKNHKLYNSMAKHDDYIFEILIKSSRDYCSNLEEKLRPSKNIGLNHSKGGLPISDERLSYVFKETVRKKISDGVKQAYQLDPTITKRAGDKKRGKTHTEEHKRKIKESSKKINRNAWENENANHEMWLQAVEMFEAFSANPEITYYKLGKSFGFKGTTAKIIHEMFKSGWNPLNDQNYLKYKD